MSKPSGSRKSKRPDGRQKPKTRQQQQQEVNAYIYSKMDALDKVLSHMAQRVELVSQLTQQMITTMVILNEKGLVTNAEIAEKQAELMLPPEERIAGLADEVSRRAEEAGGGEAETVEGQSEKAGDVDSTGSDGDDGTGVSESGEVQSEETGTAECDGRRGLKLSDNEIEGGDKSGDDLQINGQPAVGPGVSEPTGTGNKTPHLKFD